MAGRKAMASLMKHGFSTAAGTPQRKAAILGAAGGIGQPLGLLLKFNPLVSQLALYHIAGMMGVRADISHVNPRAEVAQKLEYRNWSCQISKAQGLNALEAALGTPFSNTPQVAPPKPLVIVLSGPSGVGKDAVIKRLQEVRKGLHFIVTATTRPKRPGEVHGIDYFFVSKDEFEKLIEENELLEFALVYGDYKGIPKQQVRDCISKGTDVVLRVDVQGATTIRSILGSNAVFIFLVAESEVALVQRLVGRKTESVDNMVLRIATAREELKHLSDFDYVVVNADGQLEKTVNTICCIIDAERAKVQQRSITI